jgi:hypothetical protein
MSKAKARLRKRTRTTGRPRTQAKSEARSRLLGGLTRQQVREGADACTQALMAATQQAQAHARGGYADAAVQGAFLVPLKATYAAMDLLSEALHTPPAARTPPRLYGRVLCVLSPLCGNRPVGGLCLTFRTPRMVIHGIS